MEIRNKIYCFALLLIFIFLSSPAHSQESGFQITRTADGFNFEQTISFPAVRNVIRYEVEIEEYINGEPYPLEKIETTENSINVSLSSGYYRYRYSTYNRMNLLDGISEWQDFRVIPSLPPEIESYRPFYALFFDVREPTGDLYIYGNEFSEHSEFALVRNPNYNWTGVSLDGRRNVIQPIQVEVNGNEARLTFLRSGLNRGNYGIFIRNPGGAWSSFGSVRVNYKSGVDFTFSFGYTPTLALFDIENSIGRSYSDSSGNLIIEKHAVDIFNPLGANLRFSFIPIKTKIGNFGVEVQINFLYDNYYYNFPTNLFDYMRFGTLNLLYQLPMTERLQHNIRLGAFFLGESYHSFIYIDENGWTRAESEAYTLHIWYFTLGYSLQYFIWKNLYIEPGIDLYLTYNFRTNHPHFMIRPGINVGWQFGRWAELAEVAEFAKQEEDYSVPVTRLPKNDFLFSIGWTPMIPLAGMNIYGVHEEWIPGGRIYTRGNQYLEPFNAGGLSLKLAFFPIRMENSQIGFEIGTSILINKNNPFVFDDNRQFYQVFGLFSDFTLGIRYQRMLYENWYLNLIFAAGIANAYDYTEREQFNIGGYSRYVASSDVGFGLDLSSSLQFFFYKDVFVELGMNFKFILRSSEPLAIAFRPGLYIGIQPRREKGLNLPGNGLPPFLQFGRNRD